jgi:hypothetical protein
MLLITLKKQLQKVAQPWPFPRNKSNGLELSRQITKNDNHSEEEFQIVEVKKDFKNFWLLFVKIINICQKILEKTTRLSIKIDPHIHILQGE